jgi:hypothetical protein
MYDLGLYTRVGQAYVRMQLLCATFAWPRWVVWTSQGTTSSCTCPATHGHVCRLIHTAKSGLVAVCRPGRHRQVHIVNSWSTLCSSHVVSIIVLTGCGTFSRLRLVAVSTHDVSCIIMPQRLAVLAWSLQCSLARKHHCECVAHLLAWHGRKARQQPWCTCLGIDHTLKAKGNLKSSTSVCRLRILPCPRSCCLSIKYETSPHDAVSHHT